ncbi:hypothetical protein K7X08_020691 [Anisodus acutangulus]|uniref:tRNA synthetases class I catalytic domain-containing protein n=1 Tax=Anisodus acutangulus TaxID=402998 RepID=A0A9Q1MX57_9SOLA|nr:hypothetical protein K7X08_020691 [Anisodus acutangulus]
MDDLQCLPPTHQLRVTEYMEQIKDMINKIITNGCGYKIDGDVYFSINSFPKYGRGLSAVRKLKDDISGKRVKVDSRKRNPADFALWKAAKPGEPSWDSPWGPGRPGWHIECSAMSEYYLTHSFDIHGGGIDLIFPHHENEIAKSCAACCPESHISYWMHNGFVNNNGEKMSKSLGNFFTIRETLHDCEEALSSSKVVVLDGVAIHVSPEAQNLRNELDTKLADDLHTPTILNAALQDALKLMNKLKNELRQKQQHELYLSLTQLNEEVKTVLSVLGLLAVDSTSAVLQQFKESIGKSRVDGGGCFAHNRRKITRKKK